MRLRTVLEPLLSSNDVLALLLLTRDGLPVEMFGYGLRADELATHAASAASGAARACRALGLGEPKRQSLTLEQYRLDLYPVEDYLLAVVRESAARSAGDPGGEGAELLEPLRAILRGER